jgi:hypothetical protein
MEPNDCTVGEYLLFRLNQLGVDYLFGVPGDFVLAFLNQVLQSPIQYIGMCKGERGVSAPPLGRLPAYPVSGAREGRWKSISVL